MRLLLFALMLTLIAGAASAATVEVKNAWIRTPPPGAPTAASYAVVINRGIASDRLMGGRTAAATGVGVHQSSTVGGVMRMRDVPGGLAIGASATVTLAPNGYHLMLTGLKGALKPGQHVRIVLHFLRAGDVAADFVVRDQGGMAGMHM